jgi:hypothetical protein
MVLPLQNPGQGDDSLPPYRPRRVWDGERWIESLTVCRDSIGRYTRKNGTEPISQLVLPFPEN